jgi:hypothetical protein
LLYSYPASRTTTTSPPPGKHKLFGVDVNAATVDEVRRVVSEAGFECEILCAGMCGQSQYATYASSSTCKAMPG